MAAIGSFSFALRRSVLRPINLKGTETGTHALVTEKEKPKDLVTFLETLSSILISDKLLDFTFGNDIEASPEFTRSATFSIRRHRLQKRLHGPRGRRLVPGEIVILKVARARFREGVTEDDVTSEQVDALCREIQIMAHPPIQDNDNIIDLLQILWEFDKDTLRPALLIEYAEHGTLKEFLQSEYTFNVQEKKQFCVDIANGIESLHKCRVLHGDLKCDNILVFVKDSGEFVAKITDFGFSRLLAEFEVDDKVHVGGTIPFTAPEISRPVPQNMLLFTDYYAYGMLIWQLCCDGSDNLFSSTPFSGPSQDQNIEEYVAASKESPDFIQNVKTSVRLHMLDSCDDEDLLPFDMLIENLLQRDPISRSIEKGLELLRHNPWEIHNEQPEGKDEDRLTQTLRKLPDKGMIDLDQFYTAPYAVKCQITTSLARIASETGPGMDNPSRRAQACYLLSQCHFNSFGVPYGKDSEGLEWLLKAASLGHLGAQAISFRMHNSLSRDLPEEARSHLIQWLASGTETGSRIAAEDLTSLNTVESSGAYSDAKTRLKGRFCGIGVDLFSELNLTSIPDDPYKVVELIQKGSVEAKILNERGDSVLHWAAIKGRRDVINILFKDYSESYGVNDQNFYGESPLLQACRSGQLETALDLIENKGADIDLLSFTGESPLHWLISFSDEDFYPLGIHLCTTKSIISHALRNTTPYEHVGMPFIPGTPLHRAIAAHRCQIVKFLCDMGGDAFSPGIIFYNMDTLMATNSLLNTEIEKEDESSPTSFIPAHWACRAHDSRMLKLLVENGIKTPHWPDWSEMQWDSSAYDGVDLGILDIAQAVFRKNNPSDNLKKIMNNMMHKSDGLGDILYSSRSLLSYAVDPLSRFNRCALHGSRFKNEIQDTVDLLLAQPGQELNRVDWVGRTAYLVACYNNDVETIEYLLSRPELDADSLEKSWQGGWGMKPLHITVFHGNISSLRCLLNSGADPLGRKSSGLTAMHVCASAYFPDLTIAQELVAWAPSLVHKQDQNEPPFSTAVRNHDFCLATYLLEQGADPNFLLGPHKTSTVLLQVIMGANFAAVQFLLNIPNIEFLVAPAGRMTALHAVSVGRMFHDQNDEFDDKYESQDIFRVILNRFKSRENLSYRDKRGMIPLHMAAMARNIGALEELLLAMTETSADVNALYDFWGMPVGLTALDCIVMREKVPPEVQQRGAAIVARYEQKTNALKDLLETYGGKDRKQVVQERWDSLTWTQKQAAKFLSSDKLLPLANLAQNLDGLRLMGPDVKTTRQRLATERNPDEIKYDAHQEN